MACFTGGRKLCRYMVWIGCLIEVSLVTAVTGVGGVIVIAVVAYHAVVGYGNMRPGKYIIAIVDREGSRVPVWVGGMTGFAGGWNVNGRMIRVGGGIIIGRVASDAGIGWIDIISVMAGNAIVGNGCMAPGERIRVVMVECGRVPCRLSMTGFAAGWKLCSHMVWIGRLIEVCLVTAITGAGGVIVISVVAYHTVAGYGNMRPGK